MFEVSPRLVNLDEAAFFYYGATNFTPTVAEQVVCEGSKYTWFTQDAGSNPFDVSADDSRQGLVHDFAALRAGTALVREDLECRVRLR